MIVTMDIPLQPSPYFKNGRELTTLWEQDKLVPVGVPYVYLIGGNLGKPIKVYDFENADCTIPVKVQERMINSQLRRINAKTGFYEELHSKFVQHTSTDDLAA